MRNFLAWIARKLGLKKANDMRNLALNESINASKNLRVTAESVVQSIDDMLNKLNKERKI